MKKKMLVFSLFICFVFVLAAQPIPPSTPYGNPVPVEGLLS